MARIQLIRRMCYVPLMPAVQMAVMKAERSHTQLRNEGSKKYACICCLHELTGTVDVEITAARRYERRLSRWLARVIRYRHGRGLGPIAVVISLGLLGKHLLHGLTDVALATQAGIGRSGLLSAFRRLVVMLDSAPFALI